MKMKICTSGIILAIVLLPVWVGAKPIDRATAQQVAAMQVQAQSQLRSDQLPELKLVYVATANAGDKSMQAPANPNSAGDARTEPLYYVFNVGENKGFVIVSGDNYIYPVIGHSSEGSHDPNNLPPALEAWLEDTKNGILSAREKNLQAPEKVTLKWESYLSGNAMELKSTQAVSPFIQTRWNQGNTNSPNGIYNMLLPQVGNSYCVTGCVATATAQVLKYYAYPQNGQGREATEAYTSLTHGINIPSINLGAEIYDWGNMLNNYATETSNDNQKNQVARLMYHVGASVKMDYSPEGSGAHTHDAANSMVKHFDYDKSITNKDKAFYTDDEWRAILMNEIDNGRPVIYSGTSASGGAHAFLCDGYENPTSFHFNLGWGGYRDNFYTINDIEYNTINHIILNIKPNSGGKESYEITGSTFSSTHSEVNIGESFFVYSTYWNHGLYDFTGKFAIALYDEADQLIEVVGKSGDTSISGMRGGYGYGSTHSIYCNVPSSVPGGNYKIKSIAITHSEDTIPVRYPIDAVGELPLTVIVPVQEVTLDKTTLILSVGNSEQLNPIFTPASPSNTRVSWSSSDEEVATVENGLVTAVSNGTAFITVTTEDGNKTATCEVSVRNPSTVILNAVSGHIEGALVLTETTSGSGVVLPEAIPCDDSWIFAGWSIEPIYEPTEPLSEDDVSAGLIPTGLYIPLEEKFTLYAVYKKYEDRGISHIPILVENFGTGNNYALGWEIQYWYSDQGRDGTNCPVLYYREPTHDGKEIITPSVNNASIISFWIKKFSSQPNLLIQASTDGNTWSTIMQFNSEDIPSSYTEKTVTLNLTGDYRLRFFMDCPSGNTNIYAILIDDVIIFTGIEDKGYSFASVIPDCAPVTLAWTGSVDNDWSNPENWLNRRMPIATDVVTIPGTAPNFPILTERTAIGEIHFEPGAQIGGQHHLGGQYNGDYSAFVQYDLSKRNRWLMLSIPLQHVLYGDFTFGGHPLTWVRTLQATQGSDGITKGSWVTLRGGNRQAFKPGEGFVLWLDPDDNHPTRGLKRLNSIRELPFFHHHHPESPTRDLHEAVHHAHDVHSQHGSSDGVSAFYNVRLNESGTEYVRVEDDHYEVQRQYADKLAGEYEDVSFDFGENAEAKGVVALVGNPFMATLDFDQLYEANAENGFIKNSYHVWTGAAYQSYTKTGSFGVTASNAVVFDPLTNRIAPLQAFLVERPDDEYERDGGYLRFNVSMTDVNPARLRASATETNKLNITARNATASVLTYIAKREGGRSDYGTMDVRKIINGFGNVPEVYTVKPKGEEFIAVGANIINSDNLLIPIGLATSYSGEMTLSFTGMDNYDANLHLIDAAENREIDLTGLSAREYTFTYTPPKENGATAACQNRFFVRISKTPTGLAEVSAIDPVNVYSSEGLIRVVSGPTNRIREVLIYDLQGSLQHATGRLDAIACSIEKKLLTGVYVVKVVAEKNTQNVKLVIQ